MEPNLLEEEGEKLAFVSGVFFPLLKLINGAMPGFRVGGGGRISIALELCKAKI